RVSSGSDTHLSTQPAVASNSMEHRTGRARSRTAPPGLRPAWRACGGVSVRSGRRDEEGPAEDRKLLAGVVVERGELRHLVVRRPRLAALVDAGGHVDVVRARGAGNAAAH